MSGSISEVKLGIISADILALVVKELKYSAVERNFYESCEICK